MLLFVILQENSQKEPPPTRVNSQLEQQDDRLSNDNIIQNQEDKHDTVSNKSSLQSAHYQNDRIKAKVTVHSSLKLR